MSWVLSNGKNYLRKNSNQAMKACNNADKAEIYEDRRAAEKALQMVSKKMQRLGYRPVELPSPIQDGAEIQVIAAPGPAAVVAAEPIQVIADIDIALNEAMLAHDEDRGECKTKHRIAGINDELLNIDHFVEKTKGMSAFLAAAAEQRPILVEAIKQIDLEIMDIEHGIEFSKCNVVGGYQWYKMLRDARQRRRSYKDALACIEYISDLGIKSGEIEHTTRRFEGLKHRLYEPRILTELTDYFKRNGTWVG